MEVSILLFELGTVQVFTTMTTDEALAGLETKDVFWQDKVSKHTYGPFKDVYSCMVHYTEVIAMQKTPIIGEEFRAPVIYVDFQNKRRIIYG